MRCKLAALTIGLVLALPGSSAAKFACVTNTNEAPKRFPAWPACAPCRDAMPPPYCFIKLFTPLPLNAALAATQAGDQVLVNANADTGMAASGVVDGQHVIGDNPFGDPGSGLITNTSAPGLTVHRGTIEGVVVVAGAGVPAIEVALEQSTCESPARCDVLMSDFWTVGGMGTAHGIRLVSTPPEWFPEWWSIGQVTVEDLFDGISTTGCNYGPLGPCGCPICKPCCAGYTCQAGTCVGTQPPEINHTVLDGQAIFTCRSCRIDQLSTGTGFDVFQSRGPLTALIENIVHPFEQAPQISPDYRWSVRRSCDSRIDIVGARFDRGLWNTTLCGANPIKEVTGGAEPCAGDTMINAVGTCGGTFAATPNVLAAFRGAMPFACPGTNANASAIGSRWYNTATGTEAICTTAGWKTFMVGS